MMKYNETNKITLVKVTSELELQLYEINADSDSWVQVAMAI